MLTQQRAAKTTLLRMDRTFDHLWMLAVQRLADFISVLPLPPNEFYGGIWLRAGQCWLRGA